MKISELEEMLESDLAVVKDNLFQASIDTPVLHSKWMKFSTDEAYKLHILKQRMSKLKKAKWEYYGHKANERIYEKQPFNLKLTKGEIPMYLDADDDIQRLSREVMQQEMLVNRLAEAVKSIQFRHTNIKNAIEWQKLTVGEVV